MANLFIAYDLMQPGQNYDAVREKIHSCGKYAQLQFSLYYVHTSMTAQQVHDYVKSAMDINDKLAVIEAVSAVITSYPIETINGINSVWNTN